MNWIYSLLFLVEGFGAEVIGFSSTFASTRCGELGWSFVGNVNEGVVKNVGAGNYDGAIDSAVLALKEVEALLEICIEAGEEYRTGLESYGLAVTD